MPDVTLHTGFVGDRQFVLKEPSGTAANLSASGTAITFTLRRVEQSGALGSDAVTFSGLTGDASGYVSVPFVASTWADLGVGSWRGQFVVTYPDQSVREYPEGALLDVAIQQGIRS